MLISQDRDELFITFVPFHKTYEDYLRNGTNADAQTSTMLVGTVGSLGSPTRSAHMNPSRMSILFLASSFVEKSKSLVFLIVRPW